LSTEGFSPLSKKISGFNINWSFLPELDSKKIDVIKELNPEIIRFPGGSISQYWNWED
jgi:hypothetical protein